jgi:predicted PurR-regulated permease PerM
MLRRKDPIPFSIKLAAQFFIILFIGFIMYIGQPILMPLAFGGLFALLFYPLCNYFEEYGVSRPVAILITILIASFIVIGGIVLLSTQLYNFISDLPDFADKIDKVLSDIEWFLYKNFKIQIKGKSNIVENTLGRFFDTGILFLQGTISTTMTLFNFFGLVPIYIFLFLLYRTSFKEFLFIVTPSNSHGRVRKILTDIQKVVQNYVMGLLTVMVIIGLLNTGALFALGVEYAIFFGFFAAILTIIPYIGIAIGSLLPALFVFIIKGSGLQALGILAAFIFIQFLEGNFITPKITGNKVKINALAALLALVVGGYLWGAAGLIIFLPLVAILKVVFDNIESLQPLGFLLGHEIYGHSGKVLKGYAARRSARKK